jgi:hypothetical protein
MSFSIAFIIRENKDRGLLTSFIYHQLVHTTGTEGCTDGIDNSSASIDVGDELPFALGGISTFL